jgi:hypothetical protein
MKYLLNSLDGELLALATDMKIMKTIQYKSFPLSENI